MASVSFSCLLRRWPRSWHWRATPDSGLPAPDGRQIRGSFRCESYFFLSGSIKMSSDLFGNLGDGAKDFSRCLCVVDQAQEVFRQSGPVIRVWLPIDVGLRRQGSADLFNPRVTCSTSGESPCSVFWGSVIVGGSLCLLSFSPLLLFFKRKGYVKSAVGSDHVGNGALRLIQNFTSARHSLFT